MGKLKGVIVAVILIPVATVLVMWAFKICPPQGPWPTPPWCGEDAASGKDPAMSDGQVWQQPQEYLDLIAGPDWTAEEAATKIPTGHTLMDISNTFLIQDRYETTLQSMKSNQAQWVVFDNYYSYASLDPPVMGPFENKTAYSFRNATDQELEKMIEAAHQQGLKFALMSELNFDLAKGKFTTWEDSQKFWQESQTLLDRMGKDLMQPTPEQNAYWDAWFSEYTGYMLAQAGAAQRYGADLLVIGKQIDGAIRMGNTERWKKLIQEVRSVYQGPIAYAAYTNNEYSQFQDCGFMSDLDYLILYMYNAVTEDADPSIAELKTSFEMIIDRQADAFYQQSGKKVILLTPFQSRDYGARQEWFEPAALAPDVKQDLLIQAKMYEALFQALADEESVEMVWTWGYWWLENDFNREEGSPASFEKSSTVRNKPAAEVIRRWSKPVD